MKNNKIHLETLTQDTKLTTDDLQNYHDLQYDRMNRKPMWDAMTNVITGTIPDDSIIHREFDSKEKEQKISLVNYYIAKMTKIARFTFLNRLTTEQVTIQNDLNELKSSYDVAKNDIIINANDDEKKHLMQQMTVESKYKRKINTLKHRLQKTVNNNNSFREKIF